uniref:Uncharacterized protein n=1 Tax=Alexandrium monilatum TaxID=311494 RepID=A0A7S4SA03_9DINO
MVVHVPPRQSRGRALAAAVLLAAGACLLFTAPGPLCQAGLTVQAPPCLFRVGDRVRAKMPILLSNSGRGYFNEGAGEGVPPHLRDESEDRMELAAMEKIVEGGEEGTVAGILLKNEWINRPKHWKGHHRTGVMVSWDSADLPMDVAEETELEVIEGSLGARRSEQLRMEKRARRERRGS